MFTKNLIVKAKMKKIGVGPKSSNSQALKVSLFKRARELKARTVCSKSPSNQHFSPEQSETTSTSDGLSPIEGSGRESSSESSVLSSNSGSIRSCSTSTSAKDTSEKEENEELPADKGRQDLALALLRQKLENRYKHSVERHESDAALKRKNVDKDEIVTNKKKSALACTDGRAAAQKRTPPTHLKLVEEMMSLEDSSDTSKIMMKQAARAIGFKTANSYAREFLRWKNWCIVEGINFLIPTPADVATYLCNRTYDSGSFSASKSSRTAIAFYLRLRQGMDPPATDSHLVSLIMRGLARDFKVAPEKRLPWSPDDVNNMLNSLWDGNRTSLVNKRTMVLILLLFHGSARFEELQSVATTNIEISRSGGAVITFEKSKTNQTGDLTFLNLAKAPQGTPPQKDVVYMLTNYLEHMQLVGGSKFLFPAVRPQNTKERTIYHIEERAWSYEAARKAVRTVMKSTDLGGVGGEGFGLHSGRVGAALLAAENGFTPVQLAKIGRWKRLDSALQYYLPSKELKETFSKLVTKSLDKPKKMTSSKLLLLQGEKKNKSKGKGRKESQPAKKSQKVKLQVEVKVKGRPTTDEIAVHSDETGTSNPPADETFSDTSTSNPPNAKEFVSVSESNVPMYVTDPEDDDGAPIYNDVYIPGMQEDIDNIMEAEFIYASGPANTEQYFEISESAILDASTVVDSSIFNLSTVDVNMEKEETENRENLLSIPASQFF